MIFRQMFTFQQYFSLLIFDTVNHTFTEKYPEFTVKRTADKPMPISEYAYIYSLLLHFACVRSGDKHMQSICNNMIEKNQVIIAKYFEYMIKNVKYTRASIDDAMEEAGK